MVKTGFVEIVTVPVSNTVYEWYNENFLFGSSGYSPQVFIFCCKNRIRNFTVVYK